MDLDVYLSMLNSKLRMAGDTFQKRRIWSIDPDDIVLRTGINDLQQAISFSVVLKGD